MRCILLWLFTASLCLSTAMAAPKLGIPVGSQVLLGIPVGGKVVTPNGTSNSTDSNATADSSTTAYNADPPLKDMSGQVVDNKYFRLVVPSNWGMFSPVDETDTTLAACFASMDPSIYVCIFFYQQGHKQR